MRISTLLVAAAILLASAYVQAAGKADPGHAATTKPAASPGTSHAVKREPAVFLAWHAPWGTPGARETATWACDDTLAADTLYLTFDPGDEIASLIGVDAALVFHAAPGDTLGSFWDFNRQGANPFNLRIEYDPPPEGTPGPWRLVGQGGVRYHKRGDTGRLDLQYFVPASQGGPLATGVRYFLARVAIRVRRPQLGGCHQPVCVDFDHVQLSHTNGDRWINAGQRFASCNSPGGAVCAEFRKRPPTEEPMRFAWPEPPCQGPGVPHAAPKDSTRR